MLEKIINKLRFRKALPAVLFLFGMTGCGSEVINEYPLDGKIYLMQDSNQNEGDNFFLIDNQEGSCEKVLLFEDKDKDGYGDPNGPKYFCQGENPSNYVKIDNLHPADCDDNNDQIHPGLDEICDGIDNDCNGLPDDGSSSNIVKPCANDCENGYQRCADGQWGDCIDANLQPIRQPQEEIFDGQDNDCDGEIDDADVIIWKIKVDNCGFDDVPVVSISSKDGLVYTAPNLLGGAYGLDPKDGTKKWWASQKGYVSPSITTPPMIDSDGAVYIEALTKFSPPNPDPEWSVNFEQTSPLVGYALSLDKILYLTGDVVGSFDGWDGKIVGINSKDGFIKFDFTSPDGDMNGGLVVGKKSLFAGSDDGGTYELNLNGTPKKYYFGCGIYQPASFGLKNEIYMVCGNNIEAFDENGKKLWDYSPNSGTLSPIITDSKGNLYFGSAEKFYSLTSNGKERWSFKEFATLAPATLVSNGLIYISTENGLYAVQKDCESDGAADCLGAKLEEDGSFEKIRPSAVTVDNNGTIYFCNSKNNNLYAVRATNTLDYDAPWPTWQHDSQHTGNLGYKK